MDDFLGEDYFFRISSESVKGFIAEKLPNSESKSDKDIAVELYLAVRDSIRYNPFKIDLRTEVGHIDELLSSSEGHCIDKAGLLISCLRTLKIPSRIG